MDRQRCAVTLGKFDGLHIGHTKLIDATVEIAERFGIKSMVYAITNDISQSITLKEDKENFLHILGIDEFVTKSLDDGIKNMSPEEFVKDILAEELNASWVIVGENFRFGKERCADSQKLKEICKKYNIETLIVDMVFINRYSNIPVSSTIIRDCISKGDVETVREYLGRPYSIKGVVKDGKHLGRKWGFPTMNVDATKDTMLPRNGVYATVTVIDGETYRSITNVGNNPTVDNLECPRTETHIFDEEIKCYGKEIMIKFLKFIREEKSFESENELVENIKKDKEKVISYFMTSEVDKNDI